MIWFALAESALTTARTLDYDDVPVRVIDPEHLVVLAFQAGGHKRRERALDRNRSTPVSPDLIASKEAWHRHQASLPIREKVRIRISPRTSRSVDSERLLPAAAQPDSPDCRVPEVIASA